jgi:hypothetical protein
LPELGCPVSSSPGARSARTGRSPAPGPAAAERGGWSARIPSGAGESAIDLITSGGSDGDEPDAPRGRLATARRRRRPSIRGNRTRCEPAPAQAAHAALHPPAAADQHEPAKLYFRDVWLLTALIRRDTSTTGHDRARRLTLGAMGAESARQPHEHNGRAARANDRGAATAS